MRLRAAVDGEWDSIVATIIAQAKAGDMQAASLLASRLTPAPRSVGPTIEGLDIDPGLPPAGRMKAIGMATMAGEISPDQAKILSDLILAEVQMTQLSEIEARLSDLERSR